MVVYGESALLESVYIGVEDSRVFLVKVNFNNAYNEIFVPKECEVIYEFEDENDFLRYVLLEKPKMYVSLRVLFQVFIDYKKNREEEVVNVCL